jgi:hypothetical protein
LVGDGTRVLDRALDVEHRHHADREEPVVVEHVGGPAVVRAAELTLELGVVAGEARLQREGREDHLRTHTVAELIAQAVIGFPVADHGDLALRRLHQLARPQAFDEQRAPLTDGLDARHAGAECVVDALAVDLDRFGDVGIRRDVDRVAIGHDDHRKPT